MKVKLGTLKKKNYSKIELFFLRLLKRPAPKWIVISDGKQFIFSGYGGNKIDDGFNGKQIGFAADGKFANVVTFYPDNFKKIYPDLID